MLPLLLQCYANKQIFTCDGHKKFKKNKQFKFTLLANKYWVVEISMSSEQHVGTYKHYNIMNTNYKKYTLVFLMILFGAICLANMGMPML